MAIAIPLALAAYDAYQKNQQNNNVSDANKAFGAAVGRSQQQTGLYRADLRNQMLQAMNNRLGAYNGAQGMLAGAMGGAPRLNTGLPGAPPQGAVQRPGGLAGAMSGAGQPLTGGPSPTPGLIRSASAAVPHPSLAAQFMNRSGIAGAGLY